jgi:hypothetical protein
MLSFTLRENLDLEMNFYIKHKNTGQCTYTPSTDICSPLFLRHWVNTTPKEWPCSWSVFSASKFMSRYLTSLWVQSSSSCELRMWLPSTNFQVILNQYQIKLSVAYSAATRWQNDLVTKCIGDKITLCPLPCPPTGSTAVSHTGFHSCCHHLPLQCHLQAHFHQSLQNEVLFSTLFCPQDMCYYDNEKLLLNSEQHCGCHSFSSAEKDCMGKSVSQMMGCHQPWTINTCKNIALSVIFTPS